MANAPQFPLDKKIHLSVTSSINSIKLPITTLIDSGATESFIDEAFVKQHSLETAKLKTARLLFLFDGSPSTNGRIHEVVVTDLEVQGLGPIPVRLLVTSLQNSFPIVLGFDFLKKHNSIMDWEHGVLRPRVSPTTPPPTPPASPEALTPLALPAFAG